MLGKVVGGCRGRMKIMRYYYLQAKQMKMEKRKRL